MRLAEELGVSRSTIHELRKELQQNARALQPEAPLVDEHTETDEMFSERGGKKVIGIKILTTHPEEGPTTGEATAVMKTTVRR